MKQAYFIKFVLDFPEPLKLEGLNYVEVYEKYKSFLFDISEKSIPLMSVEEFKVNWESLGLLKDEIFISLAKKTDKKQIMHIKDTQAQRQCNC